MKKILLTLLLSLFVIPTVNAEEIDPCYNDYLIDASWYDYIGYYDVSSDTWKKTTSSNSAYNETLKYLFPVETGKTYYIRWFTDQTFSSTSFKMPTTFYYTENKEQNGQTSSFSVTASNNQLSFTYSKTSKYISFVFPESDKNILGTKFAFADFDLSTCPVVEEPEPEPIIPDTTLDNFYSIYVTKLKELSDYVIENKFLLGTLGVILSFIVLEIILNLFKKGGYH